MWNRILGKNDSEKNPSKPDGQRRSDTHRSTLRRSDSLKSTTSSRKGTRDEHRDRGFNPVSTSSSSTTRNQHPGAAQASVGTSFDTAPNDPTSDQYRPPALFRNASLANQNPTSTAGGDETPAGLDSNSRLKKGSEESSAMDQQRSRKERRGTRDRDDDRRDKKSGRVSKGAKEPAVIFDNTAYTERSTSGRATSVSDGRRGTSSFVGNSRPESMPGQQSSHVQDQFPGQFPASSATPYRPPLAAREGGPGLAAEYYGDAGQSVAEQPGIRTNSPSLIIGAEPHLQPASAVAAPPPEPSASGGVGAAASFFDGSFNADPEIEDHHRPKPFSTNNVSLIQHTSAAPVVSSYATSSANMRNQHASSAPVVPTLGAAAAGAIAGYYSNNHHFQPERPEHTSSTASGYEQIAGNSSHQQSVSAQDQNTMYSSSSRPQARPGKQPSTPSNIPLHIAGAARSPPSADHHIHHHNHYAHHPNNDHSSSLHNSHGQPRTGGSMAQQHRHRHRGPLSTLVDFFKDPDGVAQFEEYTEFIGVCRHCFAPGSSPRDAPRRHNYRRRRSNERFGSSVRVDKDSRYWSSENESRRQKNKSWLGAGMAGYGLARMGESLFKPDLDFDDSHIVHSGRVRRSHRRGSSSSSERRSRTSRGVVHRSSDTLSRRSRSNDRVANGITSDGKLYRKDSHGRVDTSAVEVDTSRRRSRSRSRDRTRKISEAALGGAAASTVYASTSHRRGSSPEKMFVRSKHDDGSRSELASVIRRGDSQHHDSQRRSRRSPEPSHRRSRRKEKKSRGFFTFSNGSSSSSGSSDVAFGTGHQRKLAKETKSNKKRKSPREADAALLGLGAAAAALALNQNQRSRRKSELVAVKASKGKGKSGKNERKGKSSSSSSEEDLWESASEGERSSADSELAYGASLHGRSQESLSSDSSGMDKWSWRWGSKKQPKKRTRDQRHSPGFDHSIAPAASPAMDLPRVPMDGNRQDSRMASSSSIPLQHVYPMPTSDPTQFDASGHDAEFPSHQPYVNARPHPVPIQHPQPVAPVSPAVYTTQSHYAHSYSAPNGPTSLPQYPHPSMVAQESAVPVESREQVPGAFPIGSEYFGSLMQDSPTEGKPRQRDSSPVTRTSEHTSSSSGARRRKSLKDDSSSVRFDLTKEQEDKDRREERRRRKEDDKRRERLGRQDLEDRNPSEQDRATKRETSSKIRSEPDTKEDSATVIKDSWAAPAAAGVIAAAIGATVVAKQRESSEDERSGRHDEARKRGEERDIEVIVKERHAPTKSTAPEQTEGHGHSSEKKPMSMWQAAAKIKRTSSHTDYAAYFTPSELLTKTGAVRQIVGANADSEVTVYQVPNVVTVEPTEFRGHSPARAYSFPIKAEDMEHRKKPLPWSVPQLNLVEATPPPSRSASVAGTRSPLSPSPLSKEIPIDIPLEPLESLTDHDVTFAQPHNVEYTVIEPKDRSTPSVDSLVDETDLPEAVPGISSLRNRMKRSESPPRANYGDDLDFTATVAAGLQDTGFDSSIVTDDPSFRRRDSPPGSEADESARSPTVVVTEIKPDVTAPRSPPHGFVEEISERHMPGSFDDDEEPVIHSRPQLTDGARSTEEATGPADNVGAQPHVYSIESVPTEPGAASNAAVDPVGNNPYQDRKVARRESVREERTQPSDNAAIQPHIYTAEPQSFEPEEVRDLTMDPSVADRQPTSMSVGSAQDQPLVEESAYSSPDKVDYPSDDSGPVTASAPVISSSSQSSKSKKKSKRRSVGFDDATSIISSPATFEDKPKESGTPEKRRKHGIFGMFGRSIESIPEPKGSQETPVQANLEDFEEPKKRGKKSKSRKAAWDEKVEAGAAEPYVPQEPEAQDDWSNSKKSKRGKEKRRSSEQDSGRITHDLPAQVIAPAFPRLDPSPSDEMLTNLEDPKADRSLDSSGPGAGIAETLERSQSHDDPAQSFLGERPGKPPLPDLPDASEDPGGQLSLEHFTPSEGDSPPPESQIESPATKADKQKWRLSDNQSSPSPTAVPLRPLRFGRRPSSPSLAKSLPSTPHASAAVDQPFTPRRRERPHSTEFKSNEFRPIWLLEKHGSRQEPAPQETYPSLPSSHTTSRASSVHEADDPFRTEGLGLAMGEPSVREHHGLAIDTSQGIFDSDLLDSQQATPTAASFHSKLLENNVPAQEDVDQHGWSQADATDGAAAGDVSTNPIDETTEERRSLHGLDDIITQRRSISSSQYVTDVTAQTPTQTGAEAPRLLEEQNSGDGKSASNISDAALGAFIGGSAVALSKLTSQQHEHPEASSNQADEEETPRDGEDLLHKPADEVPGRPTVEESRLRQEQDAQDAVDSWFTPTQPKRSQTKKDKKRMESLERTVDTTAKVPISVFEESPFPAEPAETASVPHSDASRRKPSPTAVDPSWQTALASRSDSKGKKKKNKEKSTDPWEDKSVVPDEPTAEPLPSIESPPEETMKTPEFSMADEVSVQRADAEASQEAGALPTSSKKNRKAKKKGRQLSLTGLTPDDPEEGSIAKEEGVNKQLDATFEHPDVPTVQPIETLPSSSMEEAVPYSFPSPKDFKIPDMHDHPSEKQSDALVVSTEVGFGPSRSMSEDVPYAFPSPAILTSKAPTDGLLTRAEPATNDAADDEGPLQDSTHKHAPEENPTQQLPASAPMAEAVAPHEEPLPSQESRRAASESLLSPENVPLPVDEDFDLAVPPDSPVILPIDSAQTPETSLNVLESKPKAPERGIEIGQDRQPSTMELLSGVALPGEPDDSPTVLTNAISELNLPEIASLDQAAESTRGLPEEELTKSDEQLRNEWPMISTKKAKKGKKERKSELIETKKSQDDAGLQMPAAQNALTQESEDLASYRDPADNQAVPEKYGFAPETAELEQDRRLVEVSNFGESAGDTVTDLVGEDAEWPTVGKKKKKGKKNRRVAFDEARNIQNEELQAPSIPEHPTATTSTAEEVRSLLHTPEPERAPEDAQPTLILQPDSNDPTEKNYVVSTDRSGSMDDQTDAEKSQTALPESVEPLPSPRLEPCEAVAGQQAEAAQRESSAEQEIMAGYPGLASIETAAEVQGMLAGQKALGSSLSLVEDTPTGFAKPVEADDLTWGPPSEKGKEIKTAGDVANAVVETLDSQQPSTSLETTSPMPGQFPSSEPAEEFSTKMSKKDEKNRREGVSGAFSDFQEEESKSISTWPVEMAIADDAPSILEKTGELPSTEIPMTPDVAHDEAPLAEPVPDVPEKVQHGSDTTFAISPRPQADVTVQDETSDIREMEIAMGAPSISEKHDELPSIDLSMSPEPVSNDGPSVEDDPVHSWDAAEEKPMSSIQEMNDVPLDVEMGVSPKPLEEPVNRFEEDLVSQSAVPVSRARDSDYLPSMITKEQLDAAETPTRDRETSNEATIDPVAESANLAEESVLAPAIEEASTKSNKRDKKKSKKAKALASIHETPEAPTDTVAPLDTDPPRVQATEPAVAESSAVFEEPPKSKKDKKKAKKARASAWEDDAPEASAEASEAQRAFTDITIDEPSLPIVEETPSVTEEPLESKKGKKKTKKSKALSLEEDESTNPKDESQQPEFTSIGAKALDGRSNEVEPLPVDESFRAPKEQSTSKKSKKKGKKAKFAGWDDEPVDDVAVAERTLDGEEVLGEENVEVPDYLASSKKSKKKSKKSKSVAWDDEPSVSLSTDETEQGQVKDGPQEAEDDPDVQAPADAGTLEGDEFLAPESKALSCEDEQPTATSQAPDSFGTTPGLPGQFIETTEELQVDIPGTTHEAAPDLADEVELDVTVEETKRPSTEPMPYLPLPDQSETVGEGATIPREDVRSEQDSTLATISDPYVEPVAVDQQVDDVSTLQAHQGDADASATSAGDAHKTVEEVVPCPAEETINDSSNFQAYPDDTDAKAASAPSIGDAHKTAEEVIPLPAEGTDENADAKAASAPSAGDAHKTAEETTPLLAEETVEDADAKVASAPPVDAHKAAEETTPLLAGGTVEDADAKVASAPPVDAHKAAEETTPLQAGGTVEDTSTLQAHPGDSDAKAASAPSARDARKPVGKDIPFPARERVEDVSALQAHAGDASMGDAHKPAEFTPLPAEEAVENASIPQAHPSDVGTEITSAPSAGDAHKTEETIPFPAEEIVEDASTLQCHHPDDADADAKVAPAPMGDAHKPTEEGIPLPAEETVDHSSMLSPGATNDPSGPDTIRAPADDLSHDKNQSAPSADDALKTAEEVIPLRSQGMVEDSSVLSLDPLYGPVVLDPVPSPADAVKPAENQIGSSAGDALKTAEEVIPLRSQGMVEESSLLPSDTSYEPMGVDTMASLADARAPVENQVAPSTDDAHKSAEEAVPLPSEEMVEESSLLPSDASHKPMGLDAVASLADARAPVENQVVPSMDDAHKSAEEAVPLPNEEPTVNQYPLPKHIEDDAVATSSAPTVADASKSAEEQIPLPEVGDVDVAEDLPTVSKKEKKKAKKAKKATAWDDEADSTCQADAAADDFAAPAEPDFEREASTRALADEPPALAEPALPESVETFTSFGKKDKKKTKKGKKALSQEEEEPTEVVTLPGLEAGPDFAPKEVDVPASLETAEAPREFQSISKKDKKKAKKSKKSLTFDEEEPSLVTPPADIEPAMETPVVAAEGYVPSPPIEEMTEPVDEFPSLSKKDKKKKRKKSLALDEEPSENVTPPEPDLEGPASDTMAVENPATLSEPLTAEAAADTPSASNLDQQGLKKDDSLLTFDSALSESIAPVEEARPVQISEDVVEESSLPVDTSTPADESASPGKQEKNALAFDDEPSETTAPAEFEPANELIDPAVEVSSWPTEGDVGEVNDSLLLSKKEKKKAREAREAKSFVDDKSYGTILPMGLQPITEVADEGAREADALVEPSPSFDECPSESGKEKAMSKQDKESLAFDEEPLESAKAAAPNPAFEALGSAERSMLPAEPGTAENEEFFLMSKKDRKKAKKGKKALTFDDDEPSGTTTPATPNPEAHIVGLPEAPPLPAASATPVEEFPSVSKKGKKKGKKAKKAVGWEDEDPEPVPQVQSAEALDDQLQAQNQVIPIVRELEHAEDVDPSAPQDILSDLATRTEPVEKGFAGLEAVPEAEPAAPASGKKGKKDKKNARKAQAVDWDDEVAAEPTMVSAAVDPISGTQSKDGEDMEPAEETIDDATKGVSRQADVRTLINETPAPPTVSELELAPRHERPAAVASPAEHIQSTIPPTTDASHDGSQPFQAPATPPESDLQPQADVDVSLPPQEPSAPSIDVIEDRQDQEEQATSSAQEAPISRGEEDSFITTKKSKKGKRAKKQPIIWEDDTATPPVPVQEASSSREGIDAPAPAPSRPEMAAWPTEVRLNQVGAITGVQEQLGGFGDAYAVRDEPPEPPPVADGRDDYFGSIPGYDMVHPPQTYEYEARSGKEVSPAPELPSEGIAPEREKSPNLGDASATVTTVEPDSAKEEVNQREFTNEPSRSRDVNAEPTAELDALASKKKDKKSKRKQKKQVVDDVMWEFPSMAPPLPPVAAAPGQEQVPPAQDAAGGDPVREEELHGRPREAPTVEPQSFVEPETITEGDVSRDAGSAEHEEVKVTAESQATTTEDRAVVPEESHVEGTVEDEWNAVPKKGEKGTMSRENKEAELGDFLPQPTQDREEIDAPIPLDNMPSGGKDAGLNTSRDDLGTAEHHLSKDETSATPLASAGEAMATAAAVGAGLVAAEQLGRKEAKKGKKSKKDRQASSTWAEADKESTPMADVPAGANIQERRATPEGRRSSPIQAWHQYISPGQSPKRSELYDVEDDRPRSAGSARRKRSYEKERSGMPTPERRSPVAAWHEYNTPGQSPQQSGISEYGTQQATARGDGASSKQFNRDSAVHVMDSPIVPDRSPVRRAMRDSGYPDTEASPIVGVGDGYQEAVGAASGEDHSYEKADLPGNTIPSSTSLEDPRDPSPVSSTSKERSSLLFHSSPSTREEHVQQQQQQRERVSGHDEASGVSRQDGRKQAPPPMDTPSEDYSATVKARAESLAALSGLSGAGQDAARPSLFGGPVGISSDGETALDAKRQRLKTINEYNPEESPVHNRNRELSDVGAPDHGVKTARRSGTPQAISQRRAGSPSLEQGKGMFSMDDPISHLSWSAGDGEKQHGDMERSQSRGTEQRSNMSSLVSSLPKQREYERRSLSGASNHSVESINAIIRTPPDQMRSASGMSNRSSGTPPLRRSDRSVSGDLRGATNNAKKNRKVDAKEGAKRSKAEAEIITPEPLHDPNTQRRTSRVRDMANVFEGYGDFRASPVSPSRPPSMRRRQSMQVMELESKLDQLVQENRSLQDARQRAEQGLEEAAHDRGQEMESYRDAIETRNAWIQEKDTEIVDLKNTLESLQSQVQHLTDVNQGLHAASRELDDHQERYGQLEEEHADTYQQWQQSTRELESLKDQHAQLSAGMENIVRHEVSIAVEGKTAELHRLQSELDTAQAQIRTLQAQILAAKNNPSTDDIIPDRDEDYFDAQCQSLCTAVQQWVLRFSKFSDHRACYLSSELRDEKMVDRIDNAMLDGSDPDTYLGDRVRRRDVFASVFMTMAWEYIFTRYLFGADREQRQKLKSLEKQLADSRSTPMAAVHRWRATTLALLSRRDAFVRQRAQDTEAVMHTVYDTLAAILPPPAHLVAQIQQSLRKVLDKAVDLAVEMRTQRAEYVMLPPLQPEYDTHGDLARLVYFNAALMHERGGGGGGGGAESNEELERRRAVVRMVLFPLVVKKGDDGGGGEEIVVCPAQVLVAREEKEGEGKGKGKSVRVVSAQASDVNMGNMF
ncbi:MAG: hypothetical protein LQ348_002650 [Seirophora lacunosa]|nr:MAG: hypothetical protein LQ348_002650 [Seirophora lacunosa]